MVTDLHYVWKEKYSLNSKFYIIMIIYPPIEREQQAESKFWIKKGV